MLGCVNLQQESQFHRHEEGYSYGWDGARMAVFQSFKGPFCSFPKLRMFEAVNELSNLSNSPNTKWIKDPDGSRCLLEELLIHCDTRTSSTASPQESGEDHDAATRKPTLRA